ncbi:Lsr2 family DNA-binding protein [Streptomyces sp. 2333.5]|uniref:Lsr2 family DNA-binding protein n=1 Tax=Streptomyces sp. 2333.5 TaxID=1938842 RepID=UPI003FA39815
MTSALAHPPPAPPQPACHRLHRDARRDQGPGKGSGCTVSERGRVPAEIREAYQKVH